jgi:Tfp pilus assembly protein PilO
MDLKNIKLNKVSLPKDKSTLIHVGMIILALIIARNIYGIQVKRAATLEHNKDVEIKKNELAKDINKAEKRINAYRKVLAEKDTNALINSLTQMAARSAIKVTSVRPEGEREYDAYNKITIRLNILARDYHKIGQFISTLENAPELYIIEYLAIKPLTQAGENADNDRLSADLSATAIIPKD